MLNQKLQLSRWLCAALSSVPVLSCRWYRGRCKEPQQNCPPLGARPHPNASRILLSLARFVRPIFLAGPWQRLVLSLAVAIVVTAASATAQPPEESLPTPTGAMRILEGRWQGWARVVLSDASRGPGGSGGAATAAVAMCVEENVSADGTLRKVSLDPGLDTCLRTSVTACGA